MLINNSYSYISGDDWAYLEETFQGVINITEVRDWSDYNKDERCAIATIVYYNAIEYVTDLIEKNGAQHFHESHISGPYRDMNRLCAKRVRCGDRCIEEQILDGTFDL